MSELVLDQLRAALALPSESELRRRLADAEPFTMNESSATLSRGEGDAA